MFCSLYSVHSDRASEWVARRRTSCLGFGVDGIVAECVCGVWRHDAVVSELRGLHVVCDIFLYLYSSAIVGTETRDESRIHTKSSRHTPTATHDTRAEHSQLHAGLHIHSHRAKILPSPRTS
jgi:hypothetical protein